MQIGDKIYLREIRLNFGKAESVELKDEASEILGINGNYICLNNFQFTSIKHAALYDGDRDELVNEVRIYDWSNDSMFNCIMATMHTTNPDKSNSIKELKTALKSHMSKRYGKYGVASNLIDSISEVD